MRFKKNANRKYGVKFVKGSKRIRRYGVSRGGVRL
jgi:hypothetical protein